MTRACNFCGREYEAKTSVSKFCSSTCRARVSKGQTPVKALPTPTPSPVRVADLPQVAKVRAELEAAGKVDTALGEHALWLAQRLASGQDPASGVAALSREMRATLAEATRGAAAESRLSSYQDELAARRKRA